MVLLSIISVIVEVASLVVCVLQLVLTSRQNRESEKNRRNV